jgi:hypothetical protein
MCQRWKQEKQACVIIFKDSIFGTVLCGTLKPVLRELSVLCLLKSFPCNHISNFEKETIEKSEEEKP